MIMTSGTYFEGYEKLTKHFGVNPQTAIEAMNMASKFCDSQVCGKCQAGGGCQDCKGRQAKEYSLNRGDLSGLDFEKSFEAIKENVKSIKKTNEYLTQSLAELKSEIEAMPNIDGCDDFLVDTFVPILEKLEKLEKADIGSELMERMSEFESRLRSPESSCKTTFETWQNGPQFQPSEKPKTHLTEYERSATCFFERRPVKYE